LGSRGFPTILTGKEKEVFKQEEPEDEKTWDTTGSEKAIKLLKNNKTGQRTWDLVPL